MTPTQRLAAIDAAFNAMSPEQRRRTDARLAGVLLGYVDASLTRLGDHDTSWALWFLGEIERIAGMEITDRGNVRAVVTSRPEAGKDTQ